MVLIKQKPIPGSRRRRRIRKKTLRAIKKAFPLATPALNTGPKLTNI